MTHGEMEMSKFKIALLVFIMSAINTPTMAGEQVVKRVPAGAVAYHFLYDLSFASGDFVGYLAFIEGVDSPLFNGVPSKDTAYFTVRITKPLPPPIGLPVEPDPGFSAFILMPGGQFTVYFDSTPGPRDWSAPDTFSEGVPVAVFEESALLSSQAVGAFPGVAFNMFSSRLIDSTPINFNGQSIDFRKLVPNGVTISNFGNALRSSDFAGASGGGTAIAIGGKLRDKSDD
jgi:hypothetical protein